RQMSSLGFEFEIFAPPRCRMSPSTLEALPYFAFSLAVSSTGIHYRSTEDFHQSRNLSYGEGFGAAKWWRRSIISAAELGAQRGNTVRLSISGRNLGEKKVHHDFMRAVNKAMKAGATPASYSVFAKAAKNLH